MVFRWCFNTCRARRDTPSRIQYSSGVVDSNGTIELQAPVQSVTLTSYSQYSQLSVLKGKYFLYTYDGSSSPGVGIYRIDSYSKISSNSTWQYVQIESPVGVRCVDETSIELVGYVNSPNANAFPPSVPDGFTYGALGRLGDGARIATGSYVGTGTYGSGNPNTLTFEFEPKIVIVYEENYRLDQYNIKIIMPGVTSFCVVYGTYSVYINAIVGLQTTWYVESASGLGSNSWPLSPKQSRRNRYPLPRPRLTIQHGCAGQLYSDCYVVIRYSFVVHLSVRGV